MKNKTAHTSKNNTSIAHGVGRRKSSVARVWLKRGSGKVTVNEQDVTTYFHTEATRTDAVKACKVTPSSTQYDMFVRVRGGGLCSQADAVKLGIARALVSFDDSLRPLLRENHLLTVDDRVKERKKYGQRSARARFQFVKR